MIRLRNCFPVLMALAFAVACRQSVEDSQTRSRDLAAAERRARLAKVWPVPPASAGAAEQFWTFRNGYLTLWEPDQTVPREVPGKDILNLHCDPARGLVVQPDMVIQQDVPLPYPPFDTLTLEGGGTRAHTPMKSVGNGYTSWAAGDFVLSRDQLERLLHGPFLVIRPLYLGERMAGMEDPDLGRQYSTPPTPMAAAFLASCQTR